MNTVQMIDSMTPSQQDLAINTFNAFFKGYQTIWIPDNYQIGDGDIIRKFFEETDKEIHEYFKNHFSVMEHCGGCLTKFTQEEFDSDMDLCRACQGPSEILAEMNSEYREEQRQNYLSELTPEELEQQEKFDKQIELMGYFC